MTKIQWTNETWNPLVGCSLASPGCTSCYAMNEAWRKSFNAKTPQYKGVVQQVKGRAVWTGQVNLVEHKLLDPLGWRRPRMVFVNSMSDLFHESVPDEWIERIFAVMALSPQNTFQVLTKRAERMRQWFANPDRADHVGLAMLAIAGTLPHGHRRVPWPLPNVWLGVSAERQREADERIPHLLSARATVRFVSLEPLLGPIDLMAIRRTRAEGFMRPLDGRFNRLNWVICGGESGKDARPMHPDWARSLRDQCAAAEVPFFFKQWGEFAPFFFRDDGAPRASFTFDDGTTVHRIGKGNAGRVIDNREHNEFPQVAA
jgi:protein gp37